MPLLKRFDGDLKEALKASDEQRVSVLRMVKAAVKNKQIEKGEELTDDEIVSVLATMVKQGRESIEQFTKGGREDLAKKEEGEVSILQTYMPPQLGNDELDKIISDAIKEVSAEGPQDMGKVMRVLMPRVKGAADGRHVNQRVRNMLESAKQTSLQ
jgi:uncharacterized protein YqeY